MGKATYHDTTWRNHHGLTGASSIAQYLYTLQSLWQWSQSWRPADDGILLTKRTEGNRLLSNVITTSTILCYVMVPFLLSSALTYLIFSYCQTDHKIATNRRISQNGTTERSSQSGLYTISCLSSAQQSYSTILTNWKHLGKGSICNLYH